VTGRSLVHRGPTECGVSECYLETSAIRRPGSTRAVEPQKYSAFGMGRGREGGGVR
jgi:hypothetical protein